MNKLTMIALCSCIAVGCGDDDVSDRPVDRGLEVDEVGFEPAVHGPDVRSVVERTRRAFRARDGVLRGGDAVVGTEVTAAGIEVTPFLWTDDDRSVAGAALRLRTAEIARGGRSVATTPSVRLAADGSAAIERGGAVEEVRNRERGLEQSWRFAAAPDATGDLVVRIAVDGQDHAARTATGLHFRDPATGLGFSYGDGTWIDAAGDRRPVPAAFDPVGRAIVLTVPDEIVRAAVYPARLDPVVTAEHGLDVPIAGPAATAQSNPSIAYSGAAGAQFLVVWADRRRSATTFSSDVYGARVSAAGVVQDAVGIPLSSTTTGFDQHAPAVAWGDDGPGGQPGHWFVVWTGSGGVRGIHIDSTGAPLGPDFAIAPQDDNPGSLPHVAFNPMSGGATGRFLVVWHKATGGIRATTFRPDSPSGGAELTTDLVSTSSPSSLGVSAGSAATGFLVTWLDHAAPAYTIFGATVSAAAVAGPVRTIATNPKGGDDHLDPVVGYAPGGGWLVAWKDESSGFFTGDIHGRRIDPAGMPTGSTFPIATGPAFQAGPAVAGGQEPFGSRLLVSWWEGSTVRGARVDLLPGGVVNVIDPAGFTISGTSGSRLAAAYDAVARTYMVVWNTPSQVSSSDIEGARVRASNGVVLDPDGIRMSSSPNQQTAPAIAACGGVYLVAWSDTRNGFDEPDIYGAITDASTPPNVLVDDIPISTAPGRQDMPDVACNGTDFFAVWADLRNPPGDRDVYGARIRASDGAVLDPTGVAIAARVEAQSEPAIAFLGAAGVYQVVWSDLRSGTGRDIYGKRVSAAGVVDAASEVNVSGPVAGDQVHPDVTWDADLGGAVQRRFLVVWQDGRNRLGSSDPNWDIYGRYIDVGGALSATIPIQTLGGGQLAPSVATRPNGRAMVGRFQLVVYQSTGIGAWAVVGTTVFPGGTTGSSIVIGSATGVDEVEPDVAVRSGDQVVVSYGRVLLGEAFDLDVHAADVDVSPLEPVGAPFVVSAAPPVGTHAVREHAPAIACSGATSCQVVYQRFSDAPPPGGPAVQAAGADRVRGRMLTY